MSNRERWIVYPLLFLALGSSLKSKMTRTLVIDDIRCRTLIAGDNPGLSNSSDETGNRVIVGHMNTRSKEKSGDPGKPGKITGLFFVGEKSGVFQIDEEGVITPVVTVSGKGP